MENIGIFDILIGIVIVVAVVLVPIKFIQWQKERKELQRIQKSGIRDIDRMNNLEFETFVKMLFSEVGFISKGISIEEQKMGADFLLESHTKAVLKLARSGPNGRIGLRTIQEIVGAKAYFGTEEAWVITNTIFTDNAQKLAERANVKLINRFLLQKLILTVNPEVDAKEVKESIRVLLEEALWQKEEMNITAP